MKMKKKVLIGAVALTCLLIIVASYLFVLYKGQARYVLNTYLKALNNRDYETAISLIYKEDKLKGYTDQTLIDFMEKYFEEKDFVKVQVNKERVEEGQDETTRSFYEVKYTFQKQKVTSALSLIKIEDRWQVIFPFKIEDVHIYAPLGANVWFEDEMIAKKQKNTYTVPNVLPGDYNVRISFPNEICEDYITTISVPTETEIILPYETVEISIECMSGTVVELAGEKLVNSEGVVSFEHVLEGAYPLKIYDPYGNIETYEKQIRVTKEKSQFNVEALKLSKLGNERLKQGIDAFYTAYLAGIKKHDSRLIKAYATKTGYPQLAEDFEVWFVKDKDVQSARMEVEIEAINMTKTGAVEVETLEILNMINKEVDAGGKSYEREYQVVLKWVMKLIQQGESYKIDDRTIQESLVSYKDKTGKWIAY